MQNIRLSSYLNKIEGAVTQEKRTRDILKTAIIQVKIWKKYREKKGGVWGRHKS